MVYPASHPIQAGIRSSLLWPCTGWISECGLEPKPPLLLYVAKRKHSTYRAKHHTNCLYTWGVSHRTHSWCSDIIDTEMCKKRQKQTNTYLIAEMLMSGFCFWKGTSGWLAWALCRINKLCVSVPLCFCVWQRSEGLYLSRQVSLAGRQKKDSGLCEFTLIWGSERCQAGE